MEVGGGIILSMSLFILIIIIVVVIIWYRRRHRIDYQSAARHRPAPESVNPDYILSSYSKKPFLFDTSSEFVFFSLLSDVVGSDYHIFPQINYSHLMSINAGSHFEDRRYRSHIERKSADFVVCDKKTCVPRLIINLDGSVHYRPYIHNKDTEINEILDVIGLPILRLSNEEAKDRDLVKTRILSLLR